MKKTYKKPQIVALSSGKIFFYSPSDISAEKARSRAEDEYALTSGQKTREQLRKENGRFAFPNAKMLLHKAKRLY